MHSRGFLPAAVLGASLIAATAAAVDVNDTRMLAQPAVSATHVAFVYAGDVWVTGLAGGTARRLTSHPGEESRPRFSPDGRLLAFSAEYEGNLDVYVVPVEGGVPRRLTWHPGEDLVQGFTPDGSRVLFASPRNVHTRRHMQLFTVPVEGGLVERLPVPHAAKATFAPDGARLAYQPLYEAFRQWKNYRGGTTSRIWLYDVTTHAVEQIPQPAGRCNDTDPMWMGGTVFFLSDRDGEFNLYSFEGATTSVRRLTAHDDFPIVAASAGAGRIVYEQAGFLHLFDPAAGTAKRLVVGVAADLPDIRPRFAKGARWVRSAQISPSGARAVFELRGEIVTVPAEKGDARVLTGTPAVHERSPVWSPDGTRIAYFSDASGEYELHVAAQDGKGEVKRYSLGGAGFYERPRWSPDSAKLSFIDNSRSLYWIDLGTGKVRKVHSEVLYGPVNTMHHAWAPDSHWLAYTRLTPSYLQQVCLYSLADDRSSPITDGLADVAEAVFDASGKYLYVAASTDAGPVRDWFAMSNADMEMTNTLYLVVLAKGEPSPLARQSDEEKAAKAEETPAATDAKGGKDAAKAKDCKPDAAAKDEVKVAVDLDGLAQRILPLPVKGALFTDLQPGAKGQLYYRRSGGGANRFAREGETSLVRFDLDKREETVLADKVDSFALAKDGAKVLLRQGQSYLIAETKGKIEGSKGKLDFEAAQVRVDPRAEWRQIFHEAWRINRDYFYDPNFHGADWPAMRARYEPFLAHAASRVDVNRIIQWMCSELAVGHHRVAGGDLGERPDGVKGGLLGADLEVANGRYRFAKVFGGLNWNPELRSPLTEPGVDVRAGEYLLAVAGRDLTPPDNLYARFENTAGRNVEITVGPDSSGKGARTVTVVPIEDEAALRNRDWVEGNIRKVHQATGGRVAYVHLPNTTTLGHEYFKRYFFPQTDKQAIIIDERHNGGGQVADYYIDILRRPHTAWWAMRYGADLRTPLAAIHGPRVMLIDETAGSGGDLLPWMFRKEKLGPLVGRRTWGGLVGILGFPVLLDGGFVTAPNLAIWTEDGFVVENEGVPPDVEVEQLPADVIAGRDPQLDKAIEIALAGLAAHPPVTPQRPPFPVRARK